MILRKHWYLDENFDYEAGYDLGQWTFGFSVFFGGFSLHFGPLYFSYSNVPF